MPSEPDRPTPGVVDAVLAQLVARYDVAVDEDPRRAPTLAEPPAPGFARLVRLVPRGTDGESLTVVLTAAGGLQVYVRRSLVLELAADDPDLDDRLRALAAGLGWSRRD